MATEAEMQTLKDENERLREHNAALLAEKRDAIAATKAAEAKTTTLEQEKSDLTGRLNDALLAKPVELLVDEIASDPVVFNLLLSRSYKFELGEDNKPMLVNLDGTPVVTKGKDGKDKPVAFDAKDIAEFLVPSDAKERTEDQKRFASVLVGSRATGSGSSGGTQDGSGHIPSTTAAKPTDQQPQRFGLR